MSSFKCADSVNSQNLLDELLQCYIQISGLWGGQIDLAWGEIHSSIKNLRQCWNLGEGLCVVF